MNWLVEIRVRLMRRGRGHGEGLDAEAEAPEPHRILPLFPAKPVIPPCVGVPSAVGLWQRRLSQVRTKSAVLTGA